MPEDNKITTERVTSKMINIGRNGGLTFSNVAEVVEVARLMAASEKAVPEHLRNSPGACLGVALQAAEWEMSPYAVANKSYVVKDRIAYEAQMINAVILRRAPIKGRFKISYSGEGPSRKCMVSVTLLDSEGGGEVEYESPPISKIPVQNSPLWKGDPDQQLFYYSSRAMCRRHFPDVILGVYSPDELQEETVQQVEIESKPVFIQKQPVERPVAALNDSSPESSSPPQDQTIPPNDDSPWTARDRENFVAASTPKSPEPTTVDSDPAETPLQSLKAKMEEDAIRGAEVAAWLHEHKQIESEKLALRSIPESAIVYALENWKEIVGSVSGR